jgi:small ligand-binding sensory domain FIST
MSNASAMRFASALSTAPALDRAMAEAADALAAGLGGVPDLTLAFATPGYGDALDALPRRIGAALGGTRVLGCTGGGVIGGGRELEDGPGLALLGARLPGVALAGLRIEDDDDELEVAGVDRPGFVVIPDPFTSDPCALLAGLDARYPGSVAIGGLASGARRPGEHRLFLDDAAHATGAVALALGGAIELEPIVAQGCRPIGQPMFATRVKGGVVHELDGRPALEALARLREELDPADRALCQDALFLGVAMRPCGEVYRAGDFLIRNLLGADPASGAIAAAARLAPNAVVQFHVRDAAASSAELAGLLAARAGAAPAGALLFACLGRGRALFGEPDHDSRLFAAACGGAPLAGFFANGEIGPVHGRTHLHGYTSAFGLLRPRVAPPAR